MNHSGRAARGPVTVSGLALAVVFLLSSQSFAAGYDTPILYTARHMGMGGTAIGAVGDGSSIFHNPAGVARLRGSAELLVDVSLLMGNINAHPGTGATESLKSELTVAPLFLLGANFRITDRLKAGIAVYPGASAGGTYKYGNGALSFTDETTLLFMEIAPAVAFEVCKGLTIGAAWRFSYVSLTRIKQSNDNLVNLFDAKMTGFSGLGARIGIQWQVTPELSLGLVYRSKTVTEVSQDKGVVAEPGTDLKGKFQLPPKLGLGTRYDYGRFGAAVDVEYTFQSVNARQDFSITKDSNGVRNVVPNVLAWDDNVTVRVGGEYRLPLSDDGRTLALRLGYVFDDRVNTKKYPTAFGTPPTATHSGTLGAGYSTPRWSANFAYAYRTGSTTVTAEDQAGRDSCAGCGGPGKYAINLHGIYLDFSYRFGDISKPFEASYPSKYGAPQAL
jgi:long-subunit fatty acid transport protein